MNWTNTQGLISVATTAIVVAAVILGLYVAHRLIYERYSPVVQMMAYFDCLRACVLVEIPKIEAVIGEDTLMIEGPSCSEVCEQHKRGE